MSFIVEGNGRRVEVSYDAVEVSLSCMGLQEIPRELRRCTRLQKLVIHYNNISKLDNLPEGLQELNISINNISKLENIPSGLQKLSISFNKISKLENLPEELQELVIWDNKISKLENLPEGLQKLVIWNNKISKLENLPEGLQKLVIWNNKISKLENLPEGLQELDIGWNNKISKLENLPEGLQKLIIDCNRLKDFHKEEVPRYLRSIYTHIRSELVEDINSGKWAARHKEEDRPRILLDFLCCCLWAPSASEGPSVAHLAAAPAAVRPKRRLRRHRKKHSSHT